MNNEEDIIGFEALFESMQKCKKGVMWKKLYRLVAKAKKGESSKAKVDECFNGWKDHAAKGTSYQLLRRMEAYYKELWRNQDGISTDQNKRL